MKFKPILEDELSVKKLLVGKADYQVIFAEETVSKAGNDMIKIQLKLWDKDGMTGTIFDYLVLSEKCMWKVSQFCKSANMYETYKSGEILQGDLLEKSGKCTIAYDSKEAEHTGQLFEQLVIRSYDIKKEAANDSIPEIKDDDSFFDDIPEVLNG